MPDGKNTEMQLTHKISLDPTCNQTDYFRRAAGTHRFVWNWARKKKPPLVDSLAFLDRPAEVLPGQGELPFVEAYNAG
jgi:hypothetical protein